MTKRVLVVDDDDSIRETFEYHLGRAGYQVSTAASAEEALGFLSEFDPGVVITDLRMPGMDGLQLLGRIRAAVPETDVLVITAHEDMQSASAAMKEGAYDYLVKPLDLDRIESLVERCFRDRQLRRRTRPPAEAARASDVPRLVGHDPRMIEIYKLIGTLADTSAPVLIQGETGTGKELIARAIHFGSGRAGEPFLAVNCTALTESLLESELFGHVRGAFTGAVASHRGRFELAGSGTIFLDEIGDTTPSFQAKLLRVLEEREFYPVGGEHPRRTDARVMAATNQHLEALVEQERFRRDLYFRLKVVEIPGRAAPDPDRPGPPQGRADGLGSSDAHVGRLLLAGERPRAGEHAHAGRGVGAGPCGDAGASLPGTRRRRREPARPHRVVSAESGRRRDPRGRGAGPRRGSPQAGRRPQKEGREDSGHLPPPLGPAHRQVRAGGHQA